MLVLTRRIGEKIRIHDDIVVTILDIRGDQIRVGIDAPRSVSVHREEIWEELQAENLRAASPSQAQMSKLNDIFTAQKLSGKSSKSSSAKPSDKSVEGREKDNEK